MTSPENAEPGEIVTNGVAVNENVLLMANGAGGLSLSETNDDNTVGVGVIELTGSINYVATKGDYIFAASGKQGFQIIKLNRPDDSLVTRCEDLNAYSGSSYLNINNDDTLAYRGSKRFNNINVGGNLLLCGSWTVRDGVNINADGLFEMNGTLVVGRNNRQRNVTINSGATLRVEGNLTIYGDLILNEGASIEFIGDDSVVNIFGRVTRAANTTIDGTFRDVRDVF